MPTIRARVFLDTSVLKHAIRSRTVLRPRHETISWGGKNHNVVVHDIVEVDPTSVITKDPLRREIDLLSDVAELARAGDIELLWNTESQIELMGIHLLGRHQSGFDDIPIRMVESPVKYDRLILSPTSAETWKSLQIQFLRTLDHPRYYELQRACGVHQGDRIKENQLADAFHIWCAEAGGASHFLTTDLKLTRLVAQHKKSPPQLRVVTPSQLLAGLNTPEKSS